MALRTILKKDTDEESLRKKSRPVTVFDQRLHNMIDDMVDTLKDSGGVGLAAPQVGVLKRCVVIDAGDGLIELVNPEIVSMEGSVIGAEGCLSIPGRRCTVDRPEKVTVIAQNRDGESIRLEAEGLLAVAICHEVDHLDGILYIDKMIEDVTDQMED